ncbi:hypothetical protein B4U80_05194 [Leptotrombidium deliense]|uniref:Cathepsin propeptide inhibitor domain-containing protein n=1 Tax=Leptotrombidium deliense TaxID=299467 RepID=A0A443S4Q6_9ACAR|nr:hypothetical protein B4U80_05194 [Leptotrombidium deliense]
MSQTFAYDQINGEAFSHNKIYNNQKEESYRRSIFVDNLKKIVKHNLEADLGLHSYVLGVNKFADLVSTQNRTAN